MKIKKYRAPTMHEAMKHIRQELGQDAVILNSKVVYTGGFLGLFKKKNIEVIAGVDEEIERPSKKETYLYSSNDEFQPIYKEMKQIKELIQDLRTDHENMYPKELIAHNDKLKSSEVSLNIRNELMTSLTEEFYMNQKSMTNEQIQSTLKNIVRNKISHIPFHGITFHKKYINVVGPTGVGKTTTLAKLAALVKLKHKKSIAFITTDTYRIAAIDQLKTYANILNVPVEVCYSSEDFLKAKEKLKSYDVVFIDTAGRNFLEEQYIHDLEKIIHFNDEMETFLIFSLTSKYEDMKKIYAQFSRIPIHQFIFTKYDETSSHGAMLNMVLETNIGVGYITDGQNVPDDIHQMNRERFIDFLMR